eukprot:scaffold1.g5657.t1
MAGTKRPAARDAMMWAAWALSFCGWVILLSGVASMQKECGASPVNALTQAGPAGYLAPISCDKFFRYLWWIWALLLTVLVIAAVGLATATINMFRPGGGKWRGQRGALVGLLAVTVTLLMDTANTFLYISDAGFPLVTGVMVTRARVTVAGAIISAVALFVMLILAGYYDESHGSSAKPRREKAAPAGASFFEAPPTAQAQTISSRPGPIVGAPPSPLPVSTAPVALPTVATTIGVRPGRISEGASAAAPTGGGVTAEPAQSHKQVSARRIEELACLPSEPQFTKMRSACWLAAALLLAAAARPIAAFDAAAAVDDCISAFTSLSSNYDNILTAMTKLPDNYTASDIVQATGSGSGSTLTPFLSDTAFLAQSSGLVSAALQSVPFAGGYNWTSAVERIKDDITALLASPSVAADTGSVIAAWLTDDGAQAVADACTQGVSLLEELIAGGGLDTISPDSDTLLAAASPAPLPARRRGARRMLEDGTTEGVAVATALIATGALLATAADQSAGTALASCDDGKCVGVTGTVQLTLSGWKTLRHMQLGLHVGDTLLLKWGAPNFPPAANDLSVWQVPRDSMPTCSTKDAKARSHNKEGGIRYYADLEVSPSLNINGKTHMNVNHCNVGNYAGNPGTGLKLIVTVCPKDQGLLWSENDKMYNCLKRS